MAENLTLNEVRNYDVNGVKFDLAALVQAFELGTEPGRKPESIGEIKVGQVVLAWVMGSRYRRGVVTKVGRVKVYVAYTTQGAIDTARQVEQHRGSAPGSYGIRVGNQPVALDDIRVLDAPVEPVATPVEPVATPAEPVATPAEPVATPVEPVATPAEPVAAEDEAERDERRWAYGAIIDVHAEALAEQTYRDALRLTGNRESALEELSWAAMREDWARGQVSAAGKSWETHRVKFDGTVFPRDLTLDSQDGKVDNMNNESATETVTENHTGSTVVTLLEKVWGRIRADHPELPEVVIITGSGLIGGSKWGHFRAEGWKVREGEAARKHELFLAGEALAKGASQVLQTMLHEGAHTLARVRDLQDTSRQGRWHNATFRKLAEEMGLEHKSSQADKSHGFSFVTLTAETRERYADLLDELEREIRLVCHLPVWLGGSAEPDGETGGGEKITGKPKTGDEGKVKSGLIKATCNCDEPNIIRVSQKVLDRQVISCEGCDSLFTPAG